MRRKKAADFCWQTKKERADFFGKRARYQPIVWPVAKERDGVGFEGNGNAVVGFAGYMAVGERKIFSIKREGVRKIFGIVGGWKVFRFERGGIEAGG